jgi:hypothetical protein
MKFLPAIVPISIIVEVGPIRYPLRLYTVPTAIVKILAGTFPLSADPGKVFFIISILIQSSRYRRRQREGTSRYCYNLYYVPPAIVFFAAERS